MRKALLSDLADIVNIEQQAGFNACSENQLKNSLHNHLVWVLVEDAKLLAFAIFQSVLDQSELLNIVVKKERQGRGLGRELLQGCLAQLQLQQMATCLLEVGRENVGAQKLYSDLGFIQIAVRKNYYQLASGYQDALIYQYHF